MATKKTVKKVVKTKVSKPKKFDLSIGDIKQGTEIIAAFQELEMQRGWMLLRQIFDGNMAVLQEAILKKKDPNTDAVINEAECDRLRDRYSYLEELVNTPQKYIQKFGQVQPEMPEYDPYEKTKAEKSP